MGKYDIESPAQSPELKQAQSPEQMQAQSPERKQAQSPKWVPAQIHARKQALNMEKPVHSYDKTDNLIQKETLHSKHEELHSSDFIFNS